MFGRRECLRGVLEGVVMAESRLQTSTLDVWQLKNFLGGGMYEYSTLMRCEIAFHLTSNLKPPSRDHMTNGERRKVRHKGRCDAVALSSSKEI